MPHGSDDGNRLSFHNRINNKDVFNLYSSFDESENWDSTTINGNTEKRSYSASDQLLSVDGVASTNDEKGNLTSISKNGTDFTMFYDLDNCLIKAEVGNDDVDYRYDALGRRVTNVTLDPFLLGAIEALHNDIMAHPTRLNSVIARVVDGKIYKLEWYHENYLNHAVSDKNGTIQEHYRYSAYGETAIYNDLGQSLINFYKYRHYDPQLGRDASAFSIGLEVDLGEEKEGGSTVESGDGYFREGITWGENTFGLEIEWGSPYKSGMVRHVAIVCPDGIGGSYFPLNGERRGSIDTSDFRVGSSSGGFVRGVTR